MTQIRIFNFLDDDSTYDLNRQLSGVIPPGRYGGFELDPSSNDTQLELYHSDSGHKFVNEDLSSVKTGVIVTQQGTVIRETGPIVLTIEENTTYDQRIDLIVCEHEFKSFAGGSTAIYRVIKGTPSSNPVAPALTKPNSQTVVGTLRQLTQNVPFNMSYAVYTPADIPSLGGKKPPRLVNLLDVDIPSPAGDHVVYYDGASSKFMSKSMPAWLISMRGDDRAKIYDTDVDPSFFKNVSVGGGNRMVLDIDMNRDTVMINYRGVSWYAPQGISAGPKVGKKVRVVLLGGDVLIQEGAFVSSSNYLPIKRLGGTSMGTFKVKAGSISTLIRMSDHWLWIEENEQANWAESDPDVSGFVLNKPVGPFTRLGFSADLAITTIWSGGESLIVPVTVTSKVRVVSVSNFASDSSSSLPTYIAVKLDITGTGITSATFHQSILPLAFEDGGISYKWRIHSTRDSDTNYILVFMYREYILLEPTSFPYTEYLYIRFLQIV